MASVGIGPTPVGAVVGSGRLMAVGTLLSVGAAVGWLLSVGGTLGALPSVGSGERATGDASFASVATVVGNSGVTEIGGAVIAPPVGFVRSASMQPVSSRVALRNNGSSQKCRATVTTPSSGRPQLLQLLHPPRPVLNPLISLPTVVYVFRAKSSHG